MSLVIINEYKHNNHWFEIEMSVLQLNNLEKMAMISIMATDDFGSVELSTF